MPDYPRYLPACCGRIAVKPSTPVSMCTSPTVQCSICQIKGTWWSKLLYVSRALSTKSRHFTSSHISRPSRTSRTHRNSCPAADVVIDVIDSKFSFAFSSCLSFLFHRTVSPYHISPLCLLSHVIPSLLSSFLFATFKTLPYLAVPQGTLCPFLSTSLSSLSTFTI